MENLYADLIIKDLRTIEDVKQAIREQVRQILIERGFPELAE